MSASSTALTATPLLAPPFTHFCTTLRTGNDIHTLDLPLRLTELVFVNRTASAITDLPDTSPSTTLPVVPATNGCTPSVFQAPSLSGVVWSTVYVFEPPL